MQVVSTEQTKQFYKTTRAGAVTPAESEEDMTNLEFIKTLKSGEEILNFLEHNHYGCIQTSKEIWKSHCLKEEYRGETGCRKCKIEFWDKEVEM